MIRTIKKAAEHFGIKVSEVKPMHVDFIKEQIRIENYNNLGVPKRQYGVHTNGVVEFFKPILTQAELDVSKN